jgi:peptidyl-prolyl cis-trans isomerase B (cyclophilin B)
LPAAARRAAWLTGLAAVSLTAAACGSSTNNSSRSGEGAASGAGTESESAGQASGARSASASAASEEAAAAAIPTPGCRHVPAPPSRAGEQASKPTQALDPARTYTVRLDTNCGPIVIELAVKEAPETTASFAHLVKTGYYNDLTFHRIVQGFVAQGGDPNGNGTGGPSWRIVEPPPHNLRYTKGVVAMAKGGTAPAGASGSQFFIVTGSRVSLPPVYALVGHVISGENAVDAIAGIPTEATESGEMSKPRVPVVIERATLSVH